MLTSDSPTKNVTLTLAGSGRMAQVPVAPQTTVREALRTIGLNADDFDVAHPTGERLLGLDEKPYELVHSPGESIMVTPSARVG